MRRAGAVGFGRPLDRGPWPWKLRGRATAVLAAGVTLWESGLYRRRWG